MFTNLAIERGPHIVHHVRIMSQLENHGKPSAGQILRPLTLRHFPCGRPISRETTVSLQSPDLWARRVGNWLHVPCSVVWVLLGLALFGSTRAKRCRLLLLRLKTKVGPEKFAWVVSSPKWATPCWSPSRQCVARMWKRAWISTTRTFNSQSATPKWPLARHSAACKTLGGPMASPWRSSWVNCRRLDGNLLEGPPLGACSWVGLRWSFSVRCVKLKQPKFLHGYVWKWGIPYIPPMK